MGPQSMYVYLVYNKRNASYHVQPLLSHKFDAKQMALTTWSRNFFFRWRGGDMCVAIILKEGEPNLEFLKF